MSVANPASVRTQLYQPIAALETESGGSVYVSRSQPPSLDASVSEGFNWPDPIEEPVVVAVNVPARLVPEAVDHVRDMGATRFVAQHGVGVVDVGWSEIDESRIVGLRAWAESGGGSLVIHRYGPLSGSLSRWGRTPETVDLQRRLKELFDPDRVCNPGVLPGGV
jgi:FAD/FMN-containing dehydrogenase